MLRPTEQSTAQHAPQTTGDQIAIVNSTDNQASLQTIMDNAENTMTKEASMSVGSVLIRLAKQYLDFQINQQGQMHLNENKLNQYLSELKQKVETQISQYETELKLGKEEKIENEAPTHSSQPSSSQSSHPPEKKKIDFSFLKSAWDYMQNRMTEETNQLDQVTFFEGNQAFTVIIDIQTTLALVYAAITDTEIFKPDAIDSVKNQQERFYSLWMSFKRLQYDTKQRCHQGVRHDLVICNLCETYPNVIIVSEPKRFLADLISEAIFTLIEKIKMESGQDIYLDVIKECIMGEVHPELKKQLGDKSELRNAIHRAFRYVGLDPLNQKYEIEKYIRALNVVVTLPEGLIALGNQVHILLEARTKQTNELESRTQFIEFMKTHWLKMQFSLANPEHQDTIRHLIQVETTYALCRQYGRLFKSSKVNPQLSIEAFDSIYKQIDDYYQMCLSKQAPIKATEVFLSQLEKINTALKPFGKEIEWTCNIFARWKATRDYCKTEQSNDLFNQLIQLHQEITDPDVQSHYLVNDDFLKNVFKPQNGSSEVDLDYFNINRLFLSAIVMSPKEWTPLLFERLNDTLQFLIKELSPSNRSSMNPNAQALFQSSYSDELLTQLFQALNQYKKINGLTLNEIDEEIERSRSHRPQNFYMPTLHQVNDFLSALEYLALIPESKRDTFFQYLKDHHILQSTDETLVKTEVEKPLPKSITYIPNIDKMILELCLNIPSAYLKKFINDSIDRFIRLINLPEEPGKFKLMTHLGSEYVKELLSDFSFYANVETLFESFKEESRVDFLNWLGVDFIKSWAVDASISDFIRVFPENKKLDILSQLGMDFFKKIYFKPDPPNIINLFDGFSESHRMNLFNWIGMDLIKSKIPYEAIPDFLSLFPDDQKLEVLNQFNTQSLKNYYLKSNPPEMQVLLSQFPEESRISLLKSFGIDFIKAFIIENGIKHLMEKIPRNQAISFLKMLGSNFFKQYLLSAKNISFIDFVPDEEKLSFFKNIEFDSLNRWIWKHPDAINNLTRYFPSEHRFDFLQGLGLDFLRLLLKGYTLNTIVSLIQVMPTKDRLNFLYGLGLAFFRTLSTREIFNHLNELLNCLPQAERFVFLNWLDADLLKRVAEKHPNGMISWFREISAHLTEEHTKEILILLGKEFLESQIKTSKDIEFLSRFIKVRDTSSISTTYFGLFNRSHVETPSFVLHEALFGSELPSFPQPKPHLTTLVPQSHFICGGWKYWMKLLDNWNHPDYQNQDQYQWFAAYGHDVLAGLILIRYTNGDYGLMLGAKKGCEKSLSIALLRKNMSDEDEYLYHFEKCKPNPGFYITTGSLHKIRTQLLDISDVMSKLEGDYPADRFILDISTQLNNIKTPPSGFSLN